MEESKPKKIAGKKSLNTLEEMLRMSEEDRMIPIPSKEVEHKDEGVSEETPSAPAADPPADESLSSEEAAVSPTEG